MNDQTEQRSDANSGPEEDEISLLDLLQTIVDNLKFTNDLQ